MYHAWYILVCTYVPKKKLQEVHVGLRVHKNILPYMHIFLYSFVSFEYKVSELCLYVFVNILVFDILPFRLPHSTLVIFSSIENDSKALENRLECSVPLKMSRKLWITVKNAQCP